MRKTSSAVLATALTAIVLVMGVTPVQAQRRVQLINMMTTSWKYEASGGDQMTAWQARTFNDATWQSGFGLLGVEDNPGQYAPYTFNTTISPYVPATVTYYFRAHFNMAAADYKFPLTLVLSNYVDDGNVVYLNGNEISRLRVAPGQIYTTTAGNQTAEGVVEITNIFHPFSTNGLLVGDNVIAVEVHQTSTTSSDIVHGFGLTAIVPTALSITSQPPAQLSTTANRQFVLSVGVAGGPGLYQWQRDNGGGNFVNIAGPAANQSSYTNVPTLMGTTVYRVVVSNGVNTVISTLSTVTVAADITGPIMVSANVLEEPNQTNRILIIWDEKLTNSTVCPGCGTNFTIVMGASNNVTVGVSNILYNPSGGPAPNFPPITRLTVYPSNWFRGTNYYIIVNRVRDEFNNVIAPNSVIGVGWPTTVNTNVVDWNSAWEFHNSWALGDFTIYQQPWYALDYNTATNGNWGGTGGFFATGVFWKDTAIPPDYVPCRGLLGSEMSYVRNPTLFRTTFVVPPSLATDVTLRVSTVVDDGYVLFLNGIELPSPVGRVNVPAGQPVDENLRSTSEYADGQCNSNNVQVVLRPGTNVVAVAVCQYGTESANGGDIYFGMRLDVSQTTYRTSPVPANGSPVRLTATNLRTNRNAMFSWPSNIWGYALEYTTNITTVYTTNGQTRTTNTITGPWYQAQPNMAIGMITNYPPPVGRISGPAWIFRLHKVP